MNGFAWQLNHQGLPPGAVGDGECQNEDTLERVAEGSSGGGARTLGLNKAPDS